MASKHDAKRARENIYVMQTNLARQKGQHFWAQRPVQPKIAKAPKAAPEPEPVPEPTEANEQAEAPAAAAATPDPAPKR